MISMRSLRTCQALRQIPVVFHVGTLDPQDKGYDRHHGDGLSVSAHPDAWRRIARLGDSPLYQLSNPEAWFLDVYAFLQIPAWMNIVWEWNEVNGFVVRGRYWQVCRPDCESGLDLVTSWLKYEDAVADVEGDPFAEIAEVSGYLPTDALRERVRHTRLPLPFTKDFALGVWVQENLPALCGLWWFDQLNTPSYSAPHGVIFRLDGWQPTRMPHIWYQSSAYSSRCSA